MWRARSQQHLTLAVIISDPGVVNSLENYKKVYEKPKLLNLSSCYEDFSKEEDLKGEEKYRCSSCSKDQDAKKKLEIFRLPKVLIIQLKRFS
jgi:ubiquitin carboxyl-terminal hydrolase 15